MNTRKLSVAMAALLLGAQLGSPTAAAVTEQDLVLAEAYINNGQVQELANLLAANPELLAIGGVLGDALRIFAADPSMETLLLIAQVTNGQIAIALKAATTTEVNDSFAGSTFDDDEGGDDDDEGDEGTSIY